VVEKVNGPSRYRVKHYLLKRGDSALHEIPEEAIAIVDESAVWPTQKSHTSPGRKTQHEVPVVNSGRAIDQEIFSDCFPGLRPCLLKSKGLFYWKGKITLINDEHVELIVMEGGENGEFSYQLKVVGDRWADLVPPMVLDHSYPSARMAVVEIERILNKKLFSGRVK
jgi:hypothetical protein